MDLKHGFYTVSASERERKKIVLSFSLTLISSHDDKNKTKKTNKLLLTWKQ